MKRCSFHGVHEIDAKPTDDIDGEWIRYADHCEAMKRIAGDSAQQDGLLTDPEDCNAWCPRCEGHGDETALSDNGPDAYEMNINCQHCDGHGTLYHAYKGVVRDLEQARKSRLEALAKLYLAPAPSASPGAPVAWLQTLSGAEPLVFLHSEGWEPPKVEGSRYEWRPLGFIGASPAALSDYRVKSLARAIISAYKEEFALTAKCESHLHDCITAKLEGLANSNREDGNA